MITGVPFRLQYAREKSTRRAVEQATVSPGSFPRQCRVGDNIHTRYLLAAIALGIGHRLLLVGIIPAATMVIGFALTVLYPAHYRREFGMPMQRSPSVHEGTEASRPWFAT